MHPTKAAVPDNGLRERYLSLLFLPWSILPLEQFMLSRLGDCPSDCIYLGSIDGFRVQKARR